MNRTIISGLPLYVITAVMIAYSCTHRSKRAEAVLSRAETAIKASPETALAMLDSIPYPEELPESQYACYLLLKVQAKDKSRLDISSDTLVYRAADYFQQKQDLEKTALSYYYCGRVLQSGEDHEKALVYYLKAETVAGQAGNSHLQGLIQYSAGDLFYRQLSYAEAIERFKWSIVYYSRSGDMYKDEITSYNSMGNTFLLSGQNDSAFYYYQKGLALAVQHNDTSLQVTILQNRGVAFREIGDPSRAKENLMEALALSKDEGDLPVIYLNLGRVYNDLDRKDSAGYYVRLSLQLQEKNKDARLLSSTYRLLSKIEEKAADYKKALEYHHQYTKHFASILDEKESRDLLEVQKKYDFELLQNANAKLLIERQRILLICLILTLFIVIISFVFYRKNARNKVELLQNRAELLKDQAALLEAEQNIQYLTEMAGNFNEKENSLRGVVLQHFDILTKVALLEDFLGTEKKEEGKELLRKFNKIVYGQKEGLDWDILYRSFNDLYGGFGEQLRRTFKQHEESEFRICCLSYAGLRNTEISIIMKLALNTIQCKKTLIRKKLGIAGHGSINEFLSRAMEGGEEVKN